jgi:hypothetical protein
MSLHTLFAPDHLRYEGVRPVNIALLRVLYFLMFAAMSTDAWSSIFHHQGPWDPLRAVAVCVWAAYGSLSFFGLLHPLKMLPIVVFMIFYKSLWLVVVAYPLWRADALAGSPAEELATMFIWVPVVSLFVPWRYVLQTYATWPKRAPAAAGQPRVTPAGR